MDVSAQGTSLCEEQFVKQEKEDDCIVIEDEMKWNEKWLYLGGEVRTS